MVELDTCTPLEARKAVKCLGSPNVTPLQSPHAPSQWRGGPHSGPTLRRSAERAQGAVLGIELHPPGADHVASVVGSDEESLESLRRLAAVRRVTEWPGHEESPLRLCGGQVACGHERARLVPLDIHSVHSKRKTPGNPSFMFQC